MGLAGKVALVTACGRGICKEIALTLARNGCNVAVNSYTEGNTQALVDEIQQLEVRAVSVAGDITQAAVITRMVSLTQRCSWSPMQRQISPANNYRLMVE